MKKKFLSNNLSFSSFLINGFPYRYKFIGNFINVYKFKIMINQRHAYKKIIYQLKVSYDLPIYYYLYSSKAQKALVTKEFGNAICYPEKFEVHAVYNDEIKAIGCHEDTHIIAYHTIGKPKLKLLSEGLAVYMDNKWQNYCLDCYQFLLDKYLIDEVANDFNKIDPLVSYPVSGLIVKRLIIKFGIDHFKILYLNLDESNLFEYLNI